MRVGSRRKGGVEPRPTGSKIRPTQRRSIKVNAAELARRKFLHLVASVAALAGAARDADAQAYPSRPITMIVPFPQAALLCNRTSYSRSHAALTWAARGAPGARAEPGTGTEYRCCKRRSRWRVIISPFRVIAQQAATTPSQQQHRAAVREP
jgi:hypothetical protein